MRKIQIFILLIFCFKGYSQFIYNTGTTKAIVDTIQARHTNINIIDSVIFHSGTNLVGFWNRDSTYLYINDSNIVKMSDTILIIATKSDLHDNIYALEGVIKDGDTIKLGGEYTNNIDIYSDSLRGFKIRNSNSLIDFNYDITDGITLSSHSKDYNTSSECFMDTLGWYTYFLVVGDSVTEMLADTGGLRYCSDYYWKDQTDPLWIPPKAYVDSVAQLRSGVQGDLLYHDGSGWAVLNAGTDGDILQTQGGGADPQWSTPVEIPYGFSIQAYAAGTAYNLTASSALMDFGTTDPSITITQAGTYKVTAGFYYDYSGATFAGNETLTAKLRRTNNTAADVTNSTIPDITLDIVTTFTGRGAFVQLPPVVYTTVNTDDILQLFGNLSTIPSAGNIRVTGAWINAERVY